MLERITPLVLTFNEEPNVGRALEQLTWAKRVVVVDSHSTDRTLEIARSFPNVEIVQRRFDTFAGQWNFGLAVAETEWVLALDADYVLTPELVQELRRLEPPEAISGYRLRFRYCVNGRPLRGSLYPPTVALFRRERAAYRQDGHCQRLELRGGDTQDLQGYVLHDDRKSLQRWYRSQLRYAAEEAEKLGRAPWREVTWPDRVRKVPFLSAPVVFAYCMFGKGGVLDGRAGVVYATQRALAEALISVKLIARGGAA